MAKVDVSKAVAKAVSVAGDRLRREYRARVGRVEDSAIETGNPNEIYARINEETEATPVIFPTGFDVATLEYDAPILVKRKGGQWVVVDVDAELSAEFWDGGAPANGATYAPVILRTPSSAFPLGTDLSSLATGYVKNETGTGVLSIQASPIPVSDGGTGKSSVTLGNLLLGDGTNPLTELAPSTSGNIAQSNGTTWQSVAPSFNANVITAGTLTHERGGLEADVSAYDGYIRIASGVTTNIKVTLNATTAPTVNDDSADGYSIGSLWYDITADKAYTALDVSVGSAVWKEITASGGTGTVTSVAVSSNDLTVGGSPVTTSGTISVDVPDTFDHIDTSNEGYWLIDSQNSLFDFQNLISPEFKLGIFGGNFTSKTAVLNNITIGQIAFNGYDGTSQVNSSIIRAITTDNFGANDTPSKLEFLTSADNTSTPALALTLNSDKSAVFAGALSGITSLSASGNISSSGGSVSANTSVSAGTTISAGTGLTVVTGNLGVSAGTISASGNISSTAGALSANTTVTAGTGITATTGNISASSGNVSASGTVTGGTGVIATTGDVTASSGNLSASGSVSGASASITNNTASGTLTLSQAVGTTEGRLGYDSTAKAIEGYIAGMEQGLIGTLFALTSTSTIASTAVETGFTLTGQRSATLPANFLTVGKTVRITAFGYISTTASPTMRLRLTLGGVNIINTVAVTITGLTNNIWRFDAMFTCRTTGVSGTVFAQGQAMFGATASLGASSATNTIDTTASNAIALNATWGTSSPSNTISLSNFILEALN